MILSEMDSTEENGSDSMTAVEVFFTVARNEPTTVRWRNFIKISRYVFISPSTKYPIVSLLSVISLALPSLSLFFLTFFLLYS